jgi:YggT family protein
MDFVALIALIALIDASSLTSNLWYNVVSRYDASQEASTMSSSLVQFISLLFQVLSLAILGRVLLSWVDPMGNMRITQIIRDITEPLLAPIRSLMPNMAMFDFSPIIAMLLLQALSRLLISAIAR